MSSVIFDADYWYWKALEDFIAYKDMHDFVSSDNAMNAYKSSMGYSSLAPELRTRETEIELTNHIEVSLKGSLDHFAALTIIGMCTTFEVAAKDFFRKLFLKHPKYMHEYLGSENQKGLISLSEIIDSGDFKNLIDNLSDKAANIASKGKYGEVLRRAFKICGLEKNEQFTTKINKIQNERNKIVHEKKVITREVNDVGNAHAIIAEALELLIKCALHKNITGRYTCINPDSEYNITNVTIASTNNTPNILT